MILIVLLFFILTIGMGVGIFIQLKLSRNENKFLGLILPILSFSISLIKVLNIVESSYINVFFTFLITNIPTIILGGIYYGERNKISIKKSIEKMKIEDL